MFQVTDLTSKKLLKAMASRGYTRTHAEEHYAEFQNMEDNKDYVAMSILADGGIDIQRFRVPRTIGVVDTIDEAVASVRAAL